MKAGKLNKRFNIEQNTPTRNDYGESVPAWTVLATVWGSVEPLTGREFLAQQQVQSEITTRFRIRYRNDITSKMRIVYDEKYYAIDSVIDPFEKHTFLEIMCVDGVKNG